jgi:hypothetical protein
MTARKVRQVLGALFFGALIGAGLMGIAIMRSPHSHADVDITPYSRDWANSGGASAVCQWFNQNGVTEKTIGAVMVGVQKVASVSAYEAAGIVVYAVEYRCPVYMTTLGQIVSELNQSQIKSGTVV